MQKLVAGRNFSNVHNAVNLFLPVVSFRGGLKFCVVALCVGKAAIHAGYPCVPGITNDPDSALCFHGVNRIPVLAAANGAVAVKCIWVAIFITVVFHDVFPVSR